MWAEINVDGRREMRRKVTCFTHETHDPAFHSVAKMLTHEPVCGLSLLPQIIGGSDVGIGV